MNCYEFSTRKEKEGPYLRDTVYELFPSYQRRGEGDMMEGEE